VIAPPSDTDTSDTGGVKSKLSFGPCAKTCFVLESGTWKRKAKELNAEWPTRERKRTSKARAVENSNVSAGNSHLLAGEN